MGTERYLSGSLQGPEVPASAVGIFGLSIDNVDFASYDVFGVKITPMTSQELLGLLRSRITRAEQCVVASQNMHGLHVRLWDEASRQLHNLAKTYVHIDGMPLIGLCRLAGIKAAREHRVTLNDFIWPLLTLAAHEGWRVCYVGSDSNVARAGEAEIRRKFPQIPLQAHHGFFASALEATQAVRAIAAFQPHLVLVGMGMGRQERWILQNLKTLEPACFVTVGACMEYLTGVVRTPPRWMGGLGFEWLFRFLENPSRFWYRYIVEPWFVLGYLIWYSTLKDGERAAGRFTEIQSFSEDRREAVLYETA